MGSEQKFQKNIVDYGSQYQSPAGFSTFIISAWSNFLAPIYLNKNTYDYHIYLPKITFYSSYPLAPLFSIF